MTNDIDIEKIKETINKLKPGNQLYEIRILQGGGRRKTTISGYFRGTDNLEEAFSKVDLRRSNVFYTLNVIDPECYSREQHERFLQVDDTTSDSDITAYQWMLVDLDPKRRTGISSTDQELDAACEMAGKVKKYLAGLGFLDPITALSGNGIHLLYCIDLPKTEENESLMKQCLYSLDAMFSNDLVQIDKSVFNPSRVSKLYGTIARKGASTKERPHRLAKMLDVPQIISTTNIAALRELASKMPQPVQATQLKMQKQGGFDVESWLSDKGLRVYKTTSTPDGAVKHILEECPFNDSHKAPDSMIIVQPSGAIGFRCLHNSCADRTWQDVRLMFEPDAYDDDREERERRIDDGWRVHKQYMITKKTDDEEEVKKNLPKLKSISAYDLQQMEFPDTYYAVNEMIPEGETVIAAPPKTGKSWLMLDMCLKVANGEPFLGFETNKSDTLYLALEDGDKFEQERLNIVCPDAAPKNFHFIFNDVLHLNEGFILQLDALLEQIPNTKLVVIDTLNFIQYHPAKGESAYNADYRTGRDLKAYAEAKGIAIVVVTHTTKMLHAEDEMMNVSGTNGVTGAADAVVVLSKEHRTDLDAKMFITGRKVRQSMHEIRFDDRSCLWEYKGIAEVGDKDQRERFEKRDKYFNSNIRKAVLKIANDVTDCWFGRAGSLVEKALDYNIGIEESNKEVGGFLAQMQGMFLTEDCIKIERVRNGSGASSWRIFSPIDQEDINDDFLKIGED